MSDNGENDWRFESNPDACPVCDRDEIECVCVPDHVEPEQPDIKETDENTSPSSN